MVRRDFTGHRLWLFLTYYFFFFLAGKLFLEVLCGSPNNKTEKLELSASLRGVRYREA